MKTQIFSIIFIALILFSNQSISQSDSTSANQDTTLANTFFTRAEELAKKGHYDSSNYYFEKSKMIYDKAAIQFDEAKTWEKYLDCLIKISINLRTVGKYINATEYLKKAVDVGLSKLGKNHIAIADIYYNFGIVDFYKSNYDKALEFSNEAIFIRTRNLGAEHPKIGDSYNIIGLIYERKGDYDKAREYYNKSLAIRIAYFGENHSRVADTYHNIGMVIHHEGDYDRALEYFNKSLAIRIQLFGSNNPKVADSYTLIALIYSEKKDFTKSLEYQNKALAIYLDNWGENHPYVAYSYNNIGLIHFDKGEFDEALNYLNKSLELKIKIFGDSHHIVASNYENIGLVYFKKGYFDEAIKYYDKGLAMKLKLLGQKHPSISDAYQNFGKVYYQQRDFEKALSFYQMAITSLTPDFEDMDIYCNPPLKIILSETILLGTLELKANTLERFYSLKSHQIKDIETSLETYTLAAELIDKIKCSYKAEGSKLFLGERTATLFDKAIQTALKLFELTLNNEYKEQAFLLAEKAKSSILLASLQDSKAKQFAGIPDTLLEQEKQLRIDLAFCDTQIEEEQDSLKLTDLKAKHFALNEQYQKLIEKIETDYPKYYDMKYQIHTATTPELQKILDEKSAILNYFIGDSLIHIFVVSNDGFDVMSCEIDTSFEIIIESLNKSIKKLDAYGFVDTSYQAYNLLIKPVEQFISEKEKLIIIPHSILYKIPYEALLSRKPGKEAQTDFTKLDYLINRFEISYHYSATLYLNSLSKADRLLAESLQKDNLFIGFAPVFSDEANNGYILASNLPTFDLAYAEESDVRSITLDGKRFQELQYSEKEVENIVKMYEKKRSEAIGFFHTDATEDNFKSNVGKYRYVHIATHGIINEQKPQLSGIIFSQPTDSVYTEDGILYSNETYNLDLKADLVVLSSCESGIGKLVSGEGLMALTRGFLYSGASNIVVSLWKVSDKHTSKLMIEFYKNILAEKSYARSLREAKLKMIKDAGTAFPKSWSSFVLLGE